MAPQTRIGVIATVTALASAAVWLLVRLFVVTDSFGISLTKEILVALIGTLILSGVVVSGYESWQNQRNHSKGLAELCVKWGFTFSEPGDDAQLGTLAISPLLHRYTRVLTRMSGKSDGNPVEMLDVSRWVERSNETADRFEWRHTLVLFPAPTDLPAFGLYPLTLADRYLNAVTGTRGVRFEHAGEALEPGIAARFHSHYFVWPGGRSLLGSRDAPPSEEAARLGEFFTPELITFLAEHPGWCVEVANGHVALWREDRVIKPAARAELLEGTAQVYRRLAKKPGKSRPSGRITAEQPLDYHRFTGRLFRLFVGIGVGIWLGFFVGAGVLALLITLFPQPPDWFVFVVFPALMLGGMFGGAYVGYRVARQFTGDA